MGLFYTNEVIDNPNGIPCKVLDTTSIDFTNAAPARKSAETLVRKAKGGENIETKNEKGKVESTYTAKTGEAIFVNLHNTDDIYVPGDKNGVRWKFNELAQRGYEIKRDDPKNDGVIVVNTNTEKVLHEIIQTNTCIKDTWGEGQHQFLFTGATLKQANTGKVSGIDKKAFDATWEFTPKVTPSKKV